MKMSQGNHMKYCSIDNHLGQNKNKQISNTTIFEIEMYFIINAQGIYNNYL